MATNVVSSAAVQRTPVPGKKNDKAGKPSCTVPDKIQLLLCAELILGRCPGVAGTTLLSPSLPAMISRKHASIKFVESTSQWVLKDLSVS